MLNRFSEALQNAADIIAPPPTPLQDLEYHWKIVKSFYVKEPDEQRVHVGSTNIPHHLNEMLQILLAENRKDSLEQPECIQFVMASRPLDLLVELALGDSPVGMKQVVLNWMRKLLSNMQRLPMDDPSIYQPVLKLLAQVSRSEPVAAYERDEVLFLVALTGVVLKCPQKFVNLFVDTHYEYTLKCNSSRTPQGNPLFDAGVINDQVSKHPKNLLPVAGDVQSTATNVPDQDCDRKFTCSCGDNGQFLLLVSLANYLTSPSHEIVIKACEGALMLFSLSADQIQCPRVTDACEAFVGNVMDRLVDAYLHIPEDIDPLDVDMETISWGLNVFDSTERHFIGKSPFLQFLCWLDYYDSLARECHHAELAQYLAFKFHTDLLQATVQEEVCEGTYSSKIILLAKIVKQIHSQVLHEEFVQWLVDDTAGTSVLVTILENAQENRDVVLETLPLIEVFIDRPNVRVLDKILLRYLNNRGYCGGQQAATRSWSDEEEARERRQGDRESASKSKTLAPDNIIKIINQFLLLLPRQILGDSAGTGYEEYVEDARRHYKTWVEKTREFKWPVEAVTPDKSVATVSGLGIGVKDSSTDSGIVVGGEHFDEGPLLRMLFQYIRHMTHQTYELNLAVIAIVSKLALMPHPYLHEVLLKPGIGSSPGAKTLWSALQAATREILAQVPLIDGYKEKIEATAKRLLASDNVLSETDDKNDPLLESVIVLQEFAKELAAIAYVKYHYANE